MVSNEPDPVAQPPIGEQVADVNPRLTEHYNATYADAVEVICRAHIADDSRGAKLTAIHDDGLSLRTTARDGAHRDGWVPFSRAARSLTDLESLTLEVITTARTTLGVTELTTPEAQARQVDAIRTYVTSVIRMEQLTPIFRQITFGGGDLASFEPGGHDQFIYVMTPPAGRTELTVDASFSREDFGEFTDENRPVGAYYTVRDWRPEDGEMDMLFVLHGLGDDVHAEPGLSAQWAANARPGDPVALWGPRTAYDPPADTDWLLLVADETGLPAICVILENLPEHTPAHVFIEIGDDADRLALPTRHDIHVTWSVRGDAPAGTSTLLTDAVQALDFPAGNVYAWGGAEARSMRTVTTHLRRVRGVDRARVRMVGYWRHRSTPVDLNTGD